MKLCRFEIVNRPGDEVRSGIFHEGKVYETDGQNAIGVHEPNTVRFVSPAGRPPVVRFYESFESTPGEHDLTSFYVNPGLLKGPDANLELAPSVSDVGIEVRVVAISQDGGLMIDPAEADSFLLGYGFVVVLTDRGIAGGDADARSTEARDVGMFVSPFIVTPEELVGHLMPESKDRFRWKYSLFVNNDPIVENSVFESDISFTDLLGRASYRSPVSVGEVLAWPALPVPDIELSGLGRFLMPSDRLRVVVEGLGAVTARIG